MRRFLFEARLAGTFVQDWMDDHPASTTAAVIITVFAISGAIVWSGVAS